MLSIPIPAPSFRMTSPCQVQITHDLSISDFHWHPDSSRLWLEIPRNVYREIYSVDLKKGSYEKLTDQVIYNLADLRIIQALDMLRGLMLDILAQQAELAQITPAREQVEL